MPEIWSPATWGQSAVLYAHQLACPGRTSTVTFSSAEQTDFNDVLKRIQLAATIFPTLRTSVRWRDGIPEQRTREAIPEIRISYDEPIDAGYLISLEKAASATPTTVHIRLNPSGVVTQETWAVPRASLDGRGIAALRRWFNGGLQPYQANQDPRDHAELERSTELQKSSGRAIDYMARLARRNNPMNPLGIREFHSTTLVSAQLGRDLDLTSSKIEVSSSTILFGTIVVVLSVLLDRPGALVVGSEFSNRIDPWSRDYVGALAQVALIEMAVKSNQPMREVLRTFAAGTVRAYSHARYDPCVWADRLESDPSLTAPTILLNDVRSGRTPSGCARNAFIEFQPPSGVADKRVAGDRYTDIYVHASTRPEGTELMIRSVDGVNPVLGLIVVSLTEQVVSLLAEGSSVSYGSVVESTAAIGSQNLTTTMYGNGLEAYIRGLLAAPEK